MIIVDAHLDIAYNVVRGRDPTQPAIDQPVADREVATVGLPDLRAGGVGLVCATIFCIPASYRPTGYASPQQAMEQARGQLNWYSSAAAKGLLHFVTTGREVPDEADEKSTAAIILLEGSDPIADETDLDFLFAAGVRIVGMAWRATRHAGGTGQPGPLTPAGRELVPQLDARGIIHDASHLAEESFWQLLELSQGPVIASHSNCRAIVPTDRQLSDDMIRAIADRDGVIGINFYDKFLMPPDDYGKRRCSLTDLIAHVKHICNLTGSAKHVGLGSDMDGGLGREQIPAEIQTSADLKLIGPALIAAGFSEDDAAGILGGNWQRYFSAKLP